MGLSDQHCLNISCELKHQHKRQVIAMFRQFGGRHMFGNIIADWLKIPFSEHPGSISHQRSEHQIGLGVEILFLRVLEATEGIMGKSLLNNDVAAVREVKRQRNTT